MTFNDLKNLLDNFSVHEIVQGTVEAFPKEEFTVFLHHGFRFVLRNTAEQFIELMQAWQQIEELGLPQDYTGIISKFGPDIIFEKHIKKTGEKTIQGRFPYTPFPGVDLPVRFDLKATEQFANPMPYVKILLAGCPLMGIPPLYYWEKV